jgi:hypothetical protein
MPQPLKALRDVITGIGVELDIGDIDLPELKLLCFNHPHVYSPSKMSKNIVIEGYFNIKTILTGQSLIDDCAIKH